ncbi:MAG: hypothetical protein JNK85_27715 [Verrucomicrobiales bacterium]|nr:hypothetical protein [Verrucomicrobiales bacterium]
MPPAATHPPLEHFLATLAEERTWGQVLVRRVGDGFELCHLDDRSADRESLRLVEVADLRAVAERDVDGGFRPLKSAPTLVRGWRCCPATPDALKDALHHLYPGSLPDWWAALTGRAVPVHLADVALRQLGQGRVLCSLTGPALAAVIRAACAPTACVRQRRWNAAGISPDGAEGKSVIPCLEPCALWLSFAKHCARIEESNKVPFSLAPAEIATAMAALRQASRQVEKGIRAGDTCHPLHPLQIARLLDRHASVWSHASEIDNSPHDEA